MGRAAYGKTKASDRKPRVRPQRHSAEVPKKPYSVERTNRADWIEIPVPALISEELFVAVQQQLEENRKHARARRRGAAYLLQGLTVCGHCHYAYYGKKVNRVVRGTVNYFGKPPFSPCLGQFNNLDRWLRRRIRSTKYKRIWKTDNRRMKNRYIQRLGLLTCREAYLAAS